MRPLAIGPVLIIGSLALGSMLGLARSADTNLQRGRDTLADDATGRTVRTEAVAVARQADRLLAERIDDVRTLATAPSVRSAARRAARDEGGNVLAEQPVGQLEQLYGAERRLLPGSALDGYLRSLVQDSPEMAEIVVTERNGLTVAASGRPGDFVQRDERWWKQVWDAGLYVGAADLDRSATGPGLAIASRVDGNARRLGVVKGVVPLEGLQRIATRAADEAGAQVAIVTRDGLLLAESASDHDPARMLSPGVELDETHAQAVSAALDGPDPGFDRGDAAVAGFASLSSVDGRMPTLADDAATGDAGPIELIAVVVQDTDVAFAALDGLANVRRGLWGTAWTFGVIAALLLAAALVAATRVSRRLADGIVGPLRAFGATARDIADNQLPALVTRTRTPTDDTGELPALQTVGLDTGDELDDVAAAFNIVSGTAADLASDQARSRRNVSRMFVSLGRRNQNLVGRQLELIDRLERDTADPDLLDHLFRLDHLATRMRRNAESLLVLAGEQPARRWAEPVSLTDVVRGAIAEVEDYRRVSIEDLDEAELVGSAVGDVTHMLAELIENATRFSPPDTTVEVVGQRVADGYALAVVDDGVGMSPGQLQDANRRIDASSLVERAPSDASVGRSRSTARFAEPGSASASVGRSRSTARFAEPGSASASVRRSRSTARFAEPGSAKLLGLFVVGRLAARHGITVRLAESTTQGVVARVLLPTALVEAASRSAPDDHRERDAGPSAEVQAAVAGEATPAQLDLRDEASEDGAHAPQAAPSWQDDAAVTAEIDLRQVQAAAAAARAASETAEAASNAALEPTSDADSPAAESAADPDAPVPEPTAEAGAPPAEAAVHAQAPAPEAAGEVDVSDVDTVSDDVDDAPLVAVRRRPSRRGSGPDATNGSVGGPGVPVRVASSDDDPPTGTGPPARPARRPAAAAALSSVTDDQGVALTESEREARAARDRLARFQQAVQRGRAHAQRRRNGGEHRDA